MINQIRNHEHLSSGSSPHKLTIEDFYKRIGLQGFQQQLIYITYCPRCQYGATCETFAPSQCLWAITTLDHRPTSRYSQVTDLL